MQAMSKINYHAGEKEKKILNDYEDINIILRLVENREVILILIELIPI